MFLERWTIDQIVDDRVAVARAVHRHELEATDPESLTKTVVRMEMAEFSTDQWEPEVLSVFEESELLREIGARGSGQEAVAGEVDEDTDTRPLFEGQVLWIVTPHRLAAEREGRPLGPGELEWLLRDVPLFPPEGARGFRQVVWSGAGHFVDATPAARVAVKEQYQRAVESPPARELSNG